MRKWLAIFIAIILSTSLSGYRSVSQSTISKTEQQISTTKAEQSDVKKLVEEFGRKLQTVSLLAPKELVKASMQKNYGKYITAQLMAKWIANPSKAIGRVTSSPWPDHITVNSIKKIGNNKYEVKGEIIEVTSTEKVNNGVFAKQPISLMITKYGSKWLISEVKTGATEVVKPVSYINRKFGFQFSLPASWKGYKIITGSWKALSIDASTENQKVQSGTKLSIRHPLWTKAVPRQDIPILIIPIKLWEQIKNEKYSIGAAPIPPTEITRSSKYVFAIPARYNFAFPKGYEEVEKIINSKPIHIID